MLSSYLDTPIEFLKGVGPQRADILKKELQIFSFADLLNLFPYRYIDRTQFHKIAELDEDIPNIQVKGKLVGFHEAGAGRAKRLVASLRDDTGDLELVWFKGAKWVVKNLQINKEYIAFGKLNLFNSKISMPHPELELFTGVESQVQGGMQPMYPSTEKLKARGLDNKSIGKLLKNLLAGLKPSDIVEFIPPMLMQKYGFLDRLTTLQNVHWPTTNTLMERARGRLKFEELFLIQLKILSMQVNRNLHIKGFVFEKIDDQFDHFYKEQLPFELTDAQKRVVKEIRKDVLSGQQMNRLLQGDVGSGKTIVALMTMLMAIDNGYQTALMAPTEILAQQHLKTLMEFLQHMKVKVALLTGSVKGKERKDILHALEFGEIDLIIGTHALLEDKVKFKNLGCVVIDEQHRFGVAQRAKLWAKNTQPPHILVMTATPIPRTLAMTVYGDLDVSVIDELPPGRKPIKTTHNYDSKRLAVFEFMRQEIAKGRQIYVVYPLIEESSTLDYKNLMDGYESIARAFKLPDYRVSVVHGKMKAEDKDSEMQLFANGHTHIMVATTVIEVGVNVPNASVMIIESAERFGLSQLHQLRGRVGRGAEQSYCVLMTGNKLTADARKRMQTMVATNDGFEIAEVDLKLRGPGDLEGTQQSGVLDMKIADIGRDGKILQEARNAAKQILEFDATLQLPEHQNLKQVLKEKYKGSKDWSRIS